MRGIIKVIFGQCIKTKNKNSTSIENSSSSYQIYTPTFIWKHKPKIAPSHRRLVVHPRPQTPQGESVAKHETLLLIILNIVSKYEIKDVRETATIRFFKRKSVDGNILGRWTIVETEPHTLNISCQIHFGKSIYMLGAPHVIHVVFDS